jgi:hypothetical protein
MGGARARLLIALAVIAILGGVGGPSLAVPPATAQGPLFSDSTRQADAAPVPRAVVRERVVDVNFALLDSAARGATGGVLNLNLFNASGPLFPEVTLTATRDRVQPTSSGQGMIWRGRVPGDAGSWVTLVAEKGVLAGDVQAGGRSYHIASAGGGVHRIFEIDPGAFPPDEHLLPGSAVSGGLGAPRAPVAAAVASQATPVRPDGKGASAPAPRAPAAVADDGLTVDFMVVYTAAAATDAGGQAGMDSQIDLAIANMNQAYINSGVTFRGRLVFKGQVNYTESGNISTDLNNLTAGTISNGSQTVAQLRNQFGADIVTLITAPSASACGVGWLMNPASASFASQAFNVVAGYLCGTSNQSLAHEGGHNMGLCHDWIQNDCTPEVAWGHGYVDPQNRFRDIMSYPQSCNNCPRIQYFSNLVSTYQGNPVGTAHNLPNPADNAGLLNTNASIIANFRQCVVAPCSGQQPTATPVPGLANDNFPGTSVASLPANFNLNTATATLQAGEQVPTGAGCGSGFGKSVWYSFTPAATMQVTVSTAGSNFDTIVGVWTGGALGALTQVACNDDISPGTNLQSTATFNATAGTTYRIQIGGYNAASGNLVLSISGVTVTNTPIPTPVVNCNPRPRVTVSTQPAGSNNLNVTVMPGANGWINQIGIGAATNARIDIAGQTGVTGNQTFPMPPGTTSFTFVVHHATPGQATTVPVTVVDTCGSWQTFVGGGASAF